MKRVMTTDILFRERLRPDTLRVVAASAFDVPADRVAVIESVGPEPIPDDALVVFMHQPEVMPGDFPDWYGLNVAPELLQGVVPAVDAIARELRTVAITETENYSDMTMHLPDGSARVVGLYQDDDDAFRITPEIQAMIDEASAGPRALKAADDGVAKAGRGNRPPDRTRRAS